MSKAGKQKVASATAQRTQWRSAEAADLVPTTPATEKQVAAAGQAKERRLARREPLPIEAKQVDGVFQCRPTIRQDDAIPGEMLFDACGTQSTEWVNAVIEGLAGVDGGAPEKVPGSINFGLAYLNGLAPKDEVEAALGIQMFAIHNAMTNMTTRARNQTDVDLIRVLYDQVNKLARTHVAQVEALAKLRSGGKQQVEVRYVYVDARGSQNVLGDVHAGGGRGVWSENPHQPHAHDLHPAQFTGLPPPSDAPMWSPHEAGEPVPVASDPRPEEMPDARREKPRRADDGAKRQLQDGPLRRGVREKPKTRSRARAGMSEQPR